MSTTRRKNYSFPWIFKDCRERTGPDRGVELYPPLNPSSGQTDFRVITLPGALASVSKFIYVAVKNLHPGSGILTGFPFDRRRSTNPCPTAICTRGRFTQHHCLGFFTDLHACLLVSASLKR
ncbi:hypothetical protein TRAVEDRAFT_41103 [Trametes versicolor FP-101664 SS1]|uniref:Uncharacterized protein n=1 Tax=Trametes versicolor (strain FP-101664) TaxID=717944 RepID=R7S6T7_TRAVS|nr:hypothetical protein TRAVEDRAFT_41103 [Trametes versicolor FP-101664 SS1]